MSVIAACSLCNVATAEPIDKSVLLNKNAEGNRLEQWDIATNIALEKLDSTESFSIESAYTYSYFISKTFHLKSEGTIGYLDSSWSEAQYALIGVGFSYFINDLWSLTSYVRTGFENATAIDSGTYIIAADTTNEIYFELSNGRILSLENKVGYVEYNSAYPDQFGSTSSNGYFVAENYIGFDFKTDLDSDLKLSDDVRFKISSGYEKKFGGDDEVKNILDLILSLRTVDKTSSNDKVKAELRFSYGDNDYQRIIGSLVFTSSTYPSLDDGHGVSLGPRAPTR